MIYILWTIVLGEMMTETDAESMRLTQAPNKNPIEYRELLSTKAL